MFYIVDNESQCIETHDYITGGVATLMMKNCRLMYGRPNSILAAEDIILNHSLQELEAMFNQTIQRVKQDYRH